LISGSVDREAKISALIAVLLSGDLTQQLQPQMRALQRSPAERLEAGDPAAEGLGAVLDLDLKAPYREAIL